MLWPPQIGFIDRYVDPSKNWGTTGPFKNLYPSFKAGYKMSLDIFHGNSNEEVQHTFLDN